MLVVLWCSFRVLALACLEIGVLCKVLRLAAVNLPRSTGRWVSLVWHRGNRPSVRCTLVWCLLFPFPEMLDYWISARVRITVSLFDS